MSKKQEPDYIEKFLTISVDFYEMYKNIFEKHKIYSMKVNECDKATSDLLHYLELNKLTQQEKAKTATRISEIRKDRRYFKDREEALDDIIEKFESWGQNFDGCVKKLGNIAGNARQRYRNRKNRKYTPRVIKEIAIQPKK